MTQTQIIRWDDNERETVYRGIRAIANDLKLSFDGISGADAFMLMTRGQQFLPEHRRRKIARNNVHRDLAKIIAHCLTPEQVAKRKEVMENEARAKEALERPKENIIKPAPVVQTKALEHKQPKVVAAKPPEPVEPKPSTTPMVDQLLSDMLSSVMATLTSTISDQVAIKVADLIADTIAEKVMAKIAEKQETERVNRKLPKILVIGPLKKQQPQLTNAVKGLAELKFVSSEEGAATISGKSSHCSAAVIWTSYVDHSMDSGVKKALGNNPIKRCSGGLGTLQQCIEDVALELTA